MPYIEKIVLIPVVFTVCFSQQSEDLNQARALYSKGAYRAAIEVLRPLIWQDTTQAVFYELLGLSYQAIADHENAISAFQRVKAIDSTMITTWLAIGRSYESLGMIPQAEKEYIDALAIDSTNSTVLMALGRLLMETRRWGAAKPIYERLVDQDTSVVFFKVQLGRCNSELREYDEAIVLFEQALQKNPRNVNTAFQLIAAYQATNRLISAKRIIDRALEFHPQNSILWKRKGDIVFREGVFNAAVEAYEKCATFGDTSAGLQKVLGICYHLLGENELAERLLERSYHLDGTDPSTTFYLGVVKRSLNQVEESDRYLRESAILLTAGLLADVYLQIALTSEVRNDLKEAVRYYKKALFINPSKTEILFYLATAYDKHYADRSVAELYYKKFLRLSGEEMKDRRAYARQRLSVIRESRHFSKKGPSAKN